MRLLLDVTERVIEIWGEYRVGVRLSPENTFNDLYDSAPQQTFNAVVTRLSDYPLAYLHVLEGDMMTGERNLDYAELRHRFKGWYMANNGYDLISANRALNENDADMIAFGQLFIANPDLPYRFTHNLPLNTPDSSTFYGGNEVGYIDYPAWDGN